MYRNKESKQMLLVFMADLLSLLVVYIVLGGGWLVLAKSCTRRMALNILMGDISFVVSTYVLVFVLFNDNMHFTKRGKFKELQFVIKLNVIYAGLLTMFIFMRVTNISFTRGVFAFTVAGNVVCSYIARIIIKRHLLRVTKYKKKTNKMYLITTRDRAESVVAQMNRNSEWVNNITAMAILDDDLVGQTICNIPVVATYSTMIEFAKREIIDEVFINIPYESGSSLHDILMEFENMGATVHLNIEILNQFQDFDKTFNMLGEIPVVTFANKLYDYKLLLAKRLLDIVGSIVGLLITGVITIFLAPAILIDSRGPLFFKQRRVGKNGRYFYLYKFRSMTVDAEEKKQELLEQNEMSGPIFKMSDDPRVTRVGHFIRRTSLDELPQFWNVLRGDMSLVGTRPPTVDEFKQYESYHKRRLSMKPGITGLWQVSGRSDIGDFEDVVKLDLMYIDNWSLSLDIKIILKTIVVLFSRNGAK